MTVLGIAVTINFLLPRLAPGNPAQVLIARSQRKIPASSLIALEKQLGLTNDSLWTQYWQYLGNLGLSITFYPTPVVQVLQQDLPWAIILVSAALVISYLIGTFLGIFVAWRRGSVFDSVLPPLTTFFYAVPYFWLALILLYVIGFTLNLVPLSGGYDATSVTPGLNLDFISSAAQHAILPALTIILASMSGWLLGMRNTMLTTLTEDYVLMGQAKGLPERRVMFSYALLQAVQNLDYPLMQGIFLVIALAVLGANFLADLLNAALDPRARS